MAGPTIFISYRRDHAESFKFVAELEAALINADLRVLRDVDIEPGDAWPDELWRGLMECAGAVTVISDEAPRSDSWRREWSVLAAREAHAGLPVVPVRLWTSGSKVDTLHGLQPVVAEPGEIDAAIAAVVERLSGLSAGTRSTADYLAAHRAWLSWQYREAPALGREPFSLSDVYIDTECGLLRWGQLAVDRTVDPFSEEHGGRVALVDKVLELFADPELREPVVVQGPAGSGTSAFSLHLANRLADEGLTPVLIRFRDLRVSRYDDIDALLRDAMRVAPVGEHPPAPPESLFNRSHLGDTIAFRGAEICRTVIILDGWDEVTLSGSSRFQEQIQGLLPRLREYFIERPGPPVRLVLTGRPSAIVDRSRLLRRDTPVLTIRPLNPDQLRQYADRISWRLAQVQAGWALHTGRWEPVFASYEAWFRGDGDAGADVLGSPLLALLAFRTVAELPGQVDDLFERPTALYHALIETTAAHAGQAEFGPEGTVHRGGRSLRRLLQRVASIITIQGTEAVSFEELARRLEDDDALAEWTEQATSESTLHELVVNFYFKAHPELGCEFIHKSFREYLFAEAIVAALEVVSVGHLGSHPPPPRDRGEDFAPGSTHHLASRSLAALLSPQWITPEIRTHLFWLVEQAADKDPTRWIWIRDLLADIWAWWTEGAHLRIHAERLHGRWEPKIPPMVEMIRDQIPYDDRPWRFSPSTAALDAHLGDALLQLVAFVHSLLAGDDTWSAEYEDAAPTGRECQVRDDGAVRFRPFGPETQNLIARLGSAGLRAQGGGLIGTYLRATDLSNTDLQGWDASRADFCEANLEHARAMSLRAESADLSYASLVGADLRLTLLVGANLTAADLSHANLEGAYLSSASLVGARLIATDLRSARLSNADLRGADLRKADLRKADLRDADLRSADLGGADLRDADLQGLDLRRADLRDVDLRNANLGQADLRGVELSDTDIDGIRFDDQTHWPDGFSPLQGVLSGQQHTATASIYLSTSDIEVAAEFEEAFLELVASFGVDLLAEGAPEIGSWWRRYKASQRNDSDSEIARRLEKLEHALEVVALRRPMSETNLNQADAIDKLAAAADRVDEFVAIADGVLLVKAISPDGRTRTFTKDAQRRRNT